MLELMDILRSNTKRYNTNTDIDIYFYLFCHESISEKVSLIAWNKLPIYPNIYLS